jgi:hypothetical protein
MNVKSLIAGLIWAGFTCAWATTPALAQTAAPTPAPDSEAMLRDTLAATDAFARAYGAGAAPRTELRGAAALPQTQASNDLAAVVDQFDDNATYAGTLQPFWLRGKAEIQDLWSRYFARYPDRRLIFRDRQAHVYGNTSVETGYAEMYMGASATTSVPTFMRYAITRTLRDGRWLIVNMIVDKLPAEQPATGTMPPWANTPPP